jgi:hypothetical protein
VSGDGSGLLDTIIRTAATVAIGYGISTGVASAFESAASPVLSGGEVASVPAPAVEPVGGLDVIDDFFPVPPPAAQVNALSGVGFTPDPLGAFYDDFFPAPVPASELNLLPRLVPAAASAAASAGAAGTAATGLGALGSTVAKLAGAGVAAVGKLLSGSPAAPAAAGAASVSAPAAVSPVLVLGVAAAAVYFLYKG